MAILFSGVKHFEQYLEEDHSTNVLVKVNTLSLDKNSMMRCLKESTFSSCGNFVKWSRLFGQCLVESLMKKISV